MILRIDPTRLCGRVRVPPSKSLLHRRLICQALAGATYEGAYESDDVACTAAALRALYNGECVIDCGQSGSTLRFLLPIAAAQGRTEVVFRGEARLFERPIPAPFPLQRTAYTARIETPLQPGSYRVDGTQTSQIISGLLLALPLLQAPSDIALTAPCVSRPYLDMTVAVMARHGVTVEKTPSGYRIPAPQRYAAAEYPTEADWSAAAWYSVVNALQGGKCITVENARFPSVQGDSRILQYADRLPDTLAISDTPDLLPPLALLATLQSGKCTRFTGGAFLRGKESDRLAATAKLLHTLGAAVEQTQDGLCLHGVARLHGGTIDACGDHRIAMLGAFAALFCDSPVLLHGAECVGKSYRAFWQDYAALGGKTEVIAP